MKFRLPLFFLFLLGSVLLSAQRLDYRQGELIVQFSGEVDGKNWAFQRPEIDEWKRLGSSLNIYLLRFDWRTYAEGELRRRYALDPAVVNVQLNHRLSWRKRPNDPLYPDQWQMHNTGQIGGITGADYNVEEAWDVTTGGVTINGDSIVIASIDNGVDLDHEDLQANIWVNRDEIENNNIDDDGNGYIDDRYGWNTDLESNDIEGSAADHGTPVMGQIAAVGNNGIGVTGINWNAKVMNITNNFDNVESEVIQAYSYVLEARKSYDATNGAKGAYVVATNASWGRDFAFPSDSPIWCSLYDTLGSYGIINIAAVPNSDIDVDTDGDLPSLCTSDFLVVVTSLDTNNKKVRGAAAGAVSVDLGAYGQSVFTTKKDNSYGASSGTSFAAPAVTGAFGLLFSAPCDNFGQLLRADPPAAALYLKRFIYENNQPIPTLASVTTTGGKLDVGSAMTALMANCDDCLAPSSFTASPTAGSATSIDLDWNTIADANTVTLRYRGKGDDTWIELAGITPPYRLENLLSCTQYELQLLAVCGEGAAATEIITLETDGCCRLPDDFRAEPLTGGRVIVTWSPLLAARSYQLRYRGTGEDWSERSTTDTRIELNGLENCEVYELELRTDCDTTITDYQGRLTFKTLGCGICLDAEYCTPKGFTNDKEWIAEVDMPGVLNNVTGKEIDGYTNFGDVATGSVVPGGVYPLTLTPDFTGNAFTEDFHVYVDWDQNGFLTSGELVYQQLAEIGEVANATITVPENAKIGLTRMRIIMQFTTVRTNACPNGTPSQYPGEVEDYCLNVIAQQGCPAPGFIAATYDEGDDATTLTWGASAAAGNTYVIRYRERNQQDFTEREVTGLSAEIASLNLCTSYEVQVASKCGDEVGRYRTVYLGDDCTSNREAKIVSDEWSLSPNPADVYTTVSWSASLAAGRVSLYTLDGRLLSTVITDAESRQLELATDRLAAGVYLVRLTTTDGRSGLRRLLVR